MTSTLIAYRIDAFGQWTGEARDIGLGDGLTPDWVRAPTPPDLAAGMAAVWAQEDWHVRELMTEATAPSDPAPDADGQASPKGVKGSAGRWLGAAVKVLSWPVSAATQR